MLATNDAFMAINRLKLPSRIHSIYLAYAYDAGANDEYCDYIPGPPCENPHEMSAEEVEGFVHIHTGIHGVVTWMRLNTIGVIRLLKLLSNELMRNNSSGKTSYL